uniref:Zinc finger SWIM-type containing 7 n=1 Tax=Molossus molossus TaxID=27622 RepID=A0A7J8BIZ9_MOLMO|nr:zinc finger SWIM-type containing 7 [Molossus molossus]
MAVALAAATLPTVVEELLSEMAAAVRESARIPDEHLLSLKFVFGSSALQALDLVDRQSITLISSPSGRHVYQVEIWRWGLSQQKPLKTKCFQDSLWKLVTSFKYFLHC